MISRKVDLTENHDFGDGQVHIQLVGLRTQINDWYANKPLSSDDYESLIKYEKIFSERPTLNDVFLYLTGKELRD